jgi:hypothetical protein
MAMLTPGKWRLEGLLNLAILALPHMSRRPHNDAKVFEGVGLPGSTGARFMGSGYSHNAAWPLLASDSDIHQGQSV